MLAPASRGVLADVGIETAEDLFALGGELTPGTTTRRVEVGDTPAWLKRYHYPTWKKSKGLIGRGSVYGTPPCLREFATLEAMRAVGVRAVPPMAAAARWRGPWLATHAILTRWRLGSIDLEAALSDPSHRLVIDAAARAAVLDRLGRQVGRLHAARLCHRDLFLRNIVLQEREDGDALSFLDCRRGGRVTFRHGPQYDLGCLQGDLRRVLGEDPAVRAALLAGYREGLRGG